MSFYKSSILALLLVFQSYELQAQSCEEELKAKTYLVMSYKLNVYLTHKTAKRLESTLNGDEKHQAFNNLNKHTYEDEKVCHQKELQNLIYDYMKAKEKICRSDDSYKKLDSLMDEIHIDEETCPRPFDLSFKYGNELPEDAMNMPPLMVCMILHDVMKKQTAACEK